MLEIIEPGLMTTVQDVGRIKGQALGIPPSGAQDPFALRAANILAGNDDGGPLVLRKSPGSAGLEMALLGATLRALRPCVVAIAGADMTPTINGSPVGGWASHALDAGDILKFGPAREGMRTYLAVAGGIDVPLYLGSRATHMRGGFGGLDGRKLQAGDQLPIGACAHNIKSLAGRRAPDDLIRRYKGPARLRVVVGPDDRLFTDESVEQFFSTGWKLNSQSDRTGFRFIGPQLSFKPGRPGYLIQDAGADPSNIVIDPGAPVGTIQVPSGAEPIVMGVDSPTIGGYARIGVVISTDMSALGQIRPNETVFFDRTEHTEAIEILKQQEREIAGLAEHLVKAASA